jgi:hypothetical protein
MDSIEAECPMKRRKIDDDDQTDSVAGAVCNEESVAISDENKPGSLNDGGESG